MSHKQRRMSAISIKEKPPSTARRHSITTQTKPERKLSETSQPNTERRNSMTIAQIITPHMMDTDEELQKLVTQSIETIQETIDECSKRCIKLTKEKKDITRVEYNTNIIIEKLEKLKQTTKILSSTHDLIKKYQSERKINSFDINSITRTENKTELKIDISQDNNFIQTPEIQSIDTHSHDNTIITPIIYEFQKKIVPEKETKPKFIDIDTLDDMYDNTFAPL